MINAFYLIFIISSVFAFFDFFYSEKVKNISYWFSVFVITIIFSARDYSIGAGGDTEAYVEAYKQIGNLDFYQMMQFGWEPGYVVLNKLIYILFNGDDRCFVILMSILIILPIAKYIKQISPLPNFCLLFFIASGGFIHVGLFRQMLAFSIILYGFKYLKSESCGYSNLIKFAAIICMASLFHLTALLFSFVYFIKPKVTVNALFMSFLVSLLVYLFGASIYDFLIKLSRINYAMITDGGLNKSIFLYCVAVLALVFCKKAINDNYKVDASLFMTVVALQPFCLVFGLASRVLIYFELSIVIVMSVLLNAFLGKGNRAEFVMCVNLLVIYLAYQMFIYSKYQQYMIF